MISNRPELLQEPQNPENPKVYHGPRNYFVNNSHGNNSRNCTCNLGNKIILEAIIYVIVIDAFLPWETEAQAKDVLSTILYVIVIVL